MDKRIILAVAGSGKTSYVIEHLDLDKRSLVITYTENNLRNLRNKILGKFGYFPENITLYSYFSFLYSFCFKPFLWACTNPKGICFHIPPAWTLKVPRDRRDYYFDGHSRLYHNRIAKFLEFKQVLGMINERIGKYFGSLFIDEVQDFGGHDFNFLKNIAKARLDILMVGDFYQHTFDTSRDGNVNGGLHDDLDRYTGQFEAMGLIVDRDMLQKSYRCSPTVCSFINDNLDIKILSHRQDETAVAFIGTKEDARRILECGRIIKLFYQEHYKYPCYSRNWGDCKGEDQYTDVCVVLNKGTFDKFKKGRLRELSPQTRNKLYVALSRTRNDLYLVPDELCK